MDDQLSNHLFCQCLCSGHFLTYHGPLPSNVDDFNMKETATNKDMSTTHPYVHINFFNTCFSLMQDCRKQYLLIMPIVVLVYKIALASMFQKSLGASVAEKEHLVIGKECLVIGGD